MPNKFGIYLNSSTIIFKKTVFPKGYVSQYLAIGALILNFAFKSFFPRNLLKEYIRIA